MKTLLIFSTLAVIFCSGECGFISRLFGENDSEKERDTSCVKTDVNEYLDRVLEKARKELPDPMRLPPRSTIVELNDGVLWGLSNITRLGETEVSCDGNTITIKGKITTDELKGRYTWSKEKRHSNKEGNVVFISHDFEADIEVLIKKNTTEVAHPRLQRFEIKKFKDVKIEISGASYLGWALGELTTKFSGIFQRTIAKTIQDPVTEALEREMREINIE
ncbi:mite allergen Lep d 7 isoform X2 [Parasteatoda tepidariorum]|uniref:mite allergen Lep d 7 isoform X2 n=1 Tax=Parasteatoda tepidariorum TaxID=114398 RepID=UPI00077F918C|nr:uncharacterized protein LOC107450237 isoform X2 [Parasteatoda tepidariorum]